MKLSGLQLVPPALVPVVHAALSSQGLRPDVFDASGEINPLALLSLGFDKIEIRTAFSPPTVIDLSKPASQQSDSATLQEVRPAITFSGRAGRVQIAPYGEPSGISPRVKTMGISIGVGLGAALLGVMLFGGAVFGRKK